MVATVTNLSSASSTVHYFELDGYYAKHDPAHRKASFWHGRWATNLGRHVKPGLFQSILEGRVPKTEIRLGRLRDGRHEHRPGVDITLSAPKSVSLAALLNGDRRVVRAHDEAVRATLDYVEANLLQTRDYDPATGRRPRVPARGMLAATFRHEVSRNLDPQLHTHCVIANMTRNGAGEWRSIEPTALHRGMRLIGAHYRNELASRLEGLGYAIVPTMIGRVPGFEIAGYDRSVLEAFSTRRRDILEDLRRRGLEYSAARAQQAALYTRARKAEPAKEELAAIWGARAREVGLELPASVRPLRRINGASQSFAAPVPSALDAVWRAAAHLEERTSVFAAVELKAFALGLAPGRLSMAAVDAAIDRLQRDGHLVEARLRRSDLAFVTDRALRAEREIVAWMKQSTGKPLAQSAKVERRLAASDLTAGQRDAVRTILLSSVQVVGVQGYAGSGKTELVPDLVSLAGKRKVFGLAASVGAAQTLGLKAGIPARTLQWFLKRHRDLADHAPERLIRARQEFAGSILIVDEASMIATVQMRALYRIVERLGIARLVLVGDRRQLRAVEAGQPFRQLQDAGMVTAVLDDIQRQRNPDLKAAVMAMVAGEPGRAVAGLEVHELPLEELGENAARLWLDLGPEGRAGTAILAPTHDLREDINEAVREGLRDEGVLHGVRLEIERLVSLGLTRVQKLDLANYRPGDVVVFHNDIYPYRIRADDACTVAGLEDGRVLLEHTDGKPRRIDPSGPIRYRFDVFEARTIQLQVGDRVRWTRNDKRRGLINGHHAEITAIGPRQVRLRTSDGRALSLKRGDNQLRHLDHAYSSTVHAAQGMTIDNVIAVLDSGAMTDQSLFYVEISRARDSAVLLTDNREDLVARLEAASGERMTAHEAIGVEPWTVADKEVPRPRITEARQQEQEARQETRRSERMAPPSIRREAQDIGTAPTVVSGGEAYGPGELCAGFQRDWRAHHERAQSLDEHPFYISGYRDLVARMTALVSRPDLDQGMRGVLAGYMESHRRLETDRAEIDDWLRQASQEFYREGEDLAAARERVQQLVARGREILDDEERYGMHLERLPDSRASVSAGVRSCERFLDTVDLRDQLIRDWRVHVQLAQMVDAHPLYAEGIQDIAVRLERLAGQPVPPLTEELRRISDGLEARKLVEGTMQSLGAALDRRSDLLRLAAGEAVALVPDYGDWRAVADRVLANARAVLLDKDRFAVHLEHLGRLRKLLESNVGELERALGVDDLAAGIVQDWRSNDRNAADYGDIAARAKNLAASALEQGEIPATLSRLLDHHKQMVKSRTRVERTLAEVDEIVESRRRRLEKAGDRPPAAMRGYGRWMKKADKTTAKAADILGDKERYGEHINEQEWNSLRDAIRDQEMWRRVDALPARFLLDWQDHAERARSAGVSPLDAPGYDDIAKRMNALAVRATLDRGAKRVLEQELKTYGRLREEARWLDQCLRDLKGCLEKREINLSRAAEAGIPVTDLPDYPGWRSRAESAREHIEGILRDRGTYGRHLAKLPGAENDMRDALTEIARIWKTDEEPYRRTEARIARERQQEQERQQRTRSRGISL